MNLEMHQRLDREDFYAFKLRECKRKKKLHLDCLNCLLLWLETEGHLFPGPLLVKSMEIYNNRTRKIPEKPLGGNMEKEIEEEIRR